MGQTSARTPEDDARRLGLTPGGSEISLVMRAPAGGTIEDQIRELAQANGIDPDLAVAVARKESSLNPKAVGDGGKALGTFQLHAGAAQDAGVDRTDPAGNLQGGVTYLKQLHDRYGGDSRKALMAYNGGLDNVDKGTISSAAQRYADDILGSLGRPVLAQQNSGQATADPIADARRLGLVEAPADDVPQELGSPLDQPTLRSEQPWDQFWRSMYAAIPHVTGMIGGALGGTFGAASGTAAGAVTIPGIGAVPGAVTGAALGATAGAGVGGMVGRGIQHGIDALIYGKPVHPEGYGEAANEQMLYETVGRAFAGLTGRARGSLAPTTSESAQRMATDRAYNLGLSVGEITDRPGLRRVEAMAQRGIGGFSRQKAAQARTDAAATKAVTGILNSVGPPGTSTGAGAVVQDVVTDAATRAARRMEGAVATNLAPRTGMGTAGEMAASGVQAGRTAFARQADEFGKMVNEAPPVDMTVMHDEAWRLFNEDLMPKLLENPSLAPKTAEWQRVVRAYRNASKRGEIFVPGGELQKALAEAALDKATYAPLRVLNQVLATPREMSFRGALALRGTLRDAGKGEALLAGDAAEGLATYLDTGSRTSSFQGIRGLLNETHAPYEAAAAAYNTNRQLFKTAFIEKVADTNPEAVLAGLTTAEGRFNASRIQDLRQVLLALPKTYGTPAEVAQGQKAFDTLRAEWFRREIMQDNVFGMADRMRKVDPDVLRAWYPDRVGQAVLKQAEITAKAFEGTLLGQLAVSDPSKIVQMIGASPKHVAEFQARINGLPGPVQKAQLIDRVRRAWLEESVTAGDPTGLSDRIAKTDPDLLAAWFDTPQQQAALDNLRQIGAALSTRRPVSGMGAYESLGAVTVAASLMRGNLGQALRTAIGFEGIPQFISWAMYNPSVKQYLLEAGSPTGTITGQTSAFLRALGAYRDASQPVGPELTTP